MPLPTTPPEYREWLSSLKDEIHQARRRAALAVNSEMILLYWRIGREIVQRQAVHKWGARVIDQLATDLHSEFPDVRGFSPRNLKYMRKLALTWPDQQIVQQVVAQLPWGQNVTLLDKLQDDGQRLWYARAAPPCQ
jgi:predicted nuclease of restriction endonuclease-like (RecB) superfamily